MDSQSKPPRHDANFHRLQVDTQTEAVLGEGRPFSSDNIVAHRSEDGRQGYVTDTHRYEPYLPADAERGLLPLEPGHIIPQLALYPIYNYAPGYFQNEEEYYEVLKPLIDRTYRRYLLDESEKDPSKKRAAEIAHEILRVQQELGLINNSEYAWLTSNLHLPEIILEGGSEIHLRNIAQNLDPQDWTKDALRAANMAYALVLALQYHPEICRGDGNSLTNDFILNLYVGDSEVRSEIPISQFTESGGRRVYYPHHNENSLKILQQREDLPNESLLSIYRPPMVKDLDQYFCTILDLYLNLYHLPQKEFPQVTPLPAEFIRWAGDNPVEFQIQLLNSDPIYQTLGPEEVSALLQAETYENILEQLKAWWEHETDRDLPSLRFRLAQFIQQIHDISVARHPFKSDDFTTITKEDTERVIREYFVEAFPPGTPYHTPTEDLVRMLISRLETNIAEELLKITYVSSRNFRDVQISINILAQDSRSLGFDNHWFMRILNSVYPDLDTSPKNRMARNERWWDYLESCFRQLPQVHVRIPDPQDLFHK